MTNVFRAGKKRLGNSDLARKDISHINCAILTTVVATD